MAELHYNLGLLHKEKGDLMTATEHMRSALGMFVSVGATYGVEKVQREMAEIEKLEGD
jgi:hypothetical protein